MKTTGGIESSLTLPVSPLNRFERVPIQIVESAESASRLVAGEIARLIRLKQKLGQRTVLGLATGSTPLAVYRELVRLHREEGLSFRDVVTFNLDEYFPMSQSQTQSYRWFMDEHLFRHIDIPVEHTHVPDGQIPSQEVPHTCQAYEKAILAVGGIDLQILGIGRTGHIGFNEPGSTRRSRTRLITLDHVTRRDNAPNFPRGDMVPHQALTMGIATILEARRILLLAFGEHKADTIYQSFEQEPSATIPASFLQEHDNVCVILDAGASLRLTRVRTPWLTGPLADLGLVWDDPMIRRAVVWLATGKNKPLLKLTDSDYNEKGLDELLANHGPAYNINLKVFRAIQNTITGWPSGRPNELAGKEPRRIVVFSPHPDDDVISMGGTLLRLAEQGHEVHVAHQVTGSMSVSDQAIDRYIRFSRESLRITASNDRPTTIPRADELSPEQLRSLKFLIRQIEAVHAASVCQIPEKRLHFLALPFYETGRITKSPVGAQDVKIVMDLLDSIKPHQIYAAGDLADPHGTHYLCLQAVVAALQQLSQREWMKDCTPWLYRGAWQSWDIHEIDMAVPLSPGELMRKRRAIFQHETQKDQVMFLADDQREFWQRAEERARDMARFYDKLGLAEYEALETFARLRIETMSETPSIIAI